MTVLSMPGSPGATTLTVGLATAWPSDWEPRVVVEADPCGGRLAADLGVGVEPGLMTLAVTARQRLLDRTDVLEASARVGDWRLLPAPTGLEQMPAALAGLPAVLSALSDRLPSSRAVDGGGLCLVDAGRLPVETAPSTMSRAAVTLLVTHGDAAHLELVPSRVTRLAAGGPVGLVVVEPTGWSAGEIAEFCGADVVAMLPEVATRRGHGITGLRHRTWRPWWHQVSDLALRLEEATQPVSAEEAPAS